MKCLLECKSVLIHDWPVEIALAECDGTSGGEPTVCVSNRCAAFLHTAQLEQYASGRVESTPDGVVVHNIEEWESIGRRVSAIRQKKFRNGSNRCFRGSHPRCTTGGESTRTKLLPAVSRKLCKANFLPAAPRRLYRYYRLRVFRLHAPGSNELLGSPGTSSKLLNCPLSCLWREMVDHHVNLFGRWKSRRNRYQGGVCTTTFWAFCALGAACGCEGENSMCVGHRPVGAFCNLSDRDAGSRTCRSHNHDYNLPAICSPQ